MSAIPPPYCAAVLCPGPSLARTFDPAAAHGVRIAVNSAAGAFACDWWAACDLEALEKVNSVGRPSILTRQRALERLAERRPRLIEGRENLLSCEQLAEAASPPPGWNVYSATASLVLAVHLGARRIEVFGADMRGELDFAGRRGGNRGETRWVRERNLFRRIVRWAGERCEVVLHDPPGPLPDDPPAQERAMTRNPRNPRTILETCIEGDLFIATTPHAPELRASASSESAAINGLIRAIRAHHRAHQVEGRPVPWISQPQAAPSQDVIIRQLSGLWPAGLTIEPDSGTPTPASTPEPQDEGELSHGSH